MNKGKKIIIWLGGIIGGVLVIAILMVLFGIVDINKLTGNVLDTYEDVGYKASKVFTSEINKENGEGSQINIESIIVSGEISAETLPDVLIGYTKEESNNGLWFTYLIYDDESKVFKSNIVGKEKEIYAKTIEDFMSVDEKVYERMGSDVKGYRENVLRVLSNAQARTLSSTEINNIQDRLKTQEQ